MAPVFVGAMAEVFVAHDEQMRDAINAAVTESVLLCFMMEFLNLEFRLGCVLCLCSLLFG